MIDSLSDVGVAVVYALLYARYYGDCAMRIYMYWQHKIYICIPREIMHLYLSLSYTTSTLAPGY